MYQDGASSAESVGESSEQSSRASPYGDDDSARRRAQMVHQSSNDTESPLQEDSKPAALTKQNYSLSVSLGNLGKSEEWMKYSGTHLEEVDEQEPADFQNNQMDWHNWEKYALHTEGGESGHDDDMNDASNELLQNHTNALPPMQGHRRSAAPNGAATGNQEDPSRMRMGSEDWARTRIASIGNMDDLEPIYCLSMQFDDVTLQNIYREGNDH